MTTPATLAALSAPVAFTLGLATAAILALLLAWALFRALTDLRQAAERYARGDTSKPIRFRGPFVLQRIARALDTLARRHDRRITNIEQQRNALQAVLASMVEGVVAANLDGRITWLNHAAAELLQLDPRQSIGRSVQEVIRNASLQAMLDSTLHHLQHAEREVTLPQAAGLPTDDRYFQARCVVLRDPDGQPSGALLVVHDVTRLRRLERVRRDFVANVSHELKTPISAITAAVETLLHASKEDPEAFDHFLPLMQRQALRLDAIVEDLLSLARLEQSGGQWTDKLQSGTLRPVLQAARETCLANARAKQIRINIHCEPDLQARMDPALLEQAMVNLLDNAIKYSPDATDVQVTAQTEGETVVIRVIDEGPGIEAKHLPRIFERFYRTDKARSRVLGGTGLGLSIVRHVAEALGGHVTVESTVGQGSEFLIHLRKPTAEA